MEENECKECLDFEAVEKNSTFCKHCMSCFPKQEKEITFEDCFPELAREMRFGN